MHLVLQKGSLIKMELNFDKTVMDTLFIVEGEYEKKILKRILGKILGYDLVCQGNRDTKYLEFRKYDNGNSKGKIAVFCTDESYIKSINNQEHIDMIIQELVEKHDYDVRNACIFYLFDRDPLSNTDSHSIRQLIGSLKNPYENDDFSYGGLMLLSYPCVECYKISNFEEKSFEIECGLGSELKSTYGTNPDIQDNKIDNETVLHATQQMMEWYKKHDISLDYENLDYGILESFEVQETYYDESKTYKLLSGLSCAFIELGIIELDD